MEWGHMNAPHRWFLPQTPDVLGMLRDQTEITVEGMDALVAWAGGEAAAADRVRDCEHRADERKRELRRALTAAFTTPLDPEDIFELSRGLDAVLNGAKDLVRETEVIGVEPDAPMAQMAGLLAEGVRHLMAAFTALGSTGPTDAADAAVKSQRRLERVYRDAMSALLGLDNLREVGARRELYRRLSRASDGLVDVAERVWYSVLKES
jgi:uncharacterized protein Yka (UPF0111/DUF47 family)